ncbi:putative endonuclease [Acinetobacter calcoaceticus]|uniref:UPF0102 protein EC844_102162 n=1 Tax=Acinetobacter calcoaceticus TaxID=471 RepID=A0A4R1XYS6_ACICA|nr:putative endonuclease [Acinetobacter calcoaceticus]
MGHAASHSLGAWAEAAAAELLDQHGFQAIAKNYHSRYGEIDLIVQREDVLLFVEVKARSQTRWAHAYEMLTHSKQVKLYKTALRFMELYPQFQRFFMRFDVICFDFSHEFAKNVQYDFNKFSYDLQWIENAFTLDIDLINL